MSAEPESSLEGEEISEFARICFGATPPPPPPEEPSFPFQRPICAKPMSPPPTKAEPPISETKTEPPISETKTEPPISEPILKSEAEPISQISTEPVPKIIGGVSRSPPTCIAFKSAANQHWSSWYDSQMSPRIKNYEHSSSISKKPHFSRQPVGPFLPKDILKDGPTACSPLIAHLPNDQRAVIYPIGDEYEGSKIDDQRSVNGAKSLVQRKYMSEFFQHASPPRPYLRKTDEQKPIRSVDDGYNKSHIDDQEGTQQLIKMLRKRASAESSSTPRRPSKRTNTTPYVSPFKKKCPDVDLGWRPEGWRPKEIPISHPTEVMSPSQNSLRYVNPQPSPGRIGRVCSSSIPNGRASSSPEPTSRKVRKPNSARLPTLTNYTEGGRREDNRAGSPSKSKANKTNEFTKLYVGMGSPPRVYMPPAIEKDAIDAIGDALYKRESRFDQPRKTVGSPTGMSLFDRVSQALNLDVSNKGAREDSPRARYTTPCVGVDLGCEDTIREPSFPCMKPIRRPSPGGWSVM